MDFEFESNREEVERELDKKVRKILRAIGEYCKAQVKALTPVDLGNLRNSYHYQIDTSKQQVIIGTPVDYAIYVEMGTGLYAENGDGRKTPWRYKDPKTGEWVLSRGSRPQPHLRPGVEGNKAGIIAIAEALWEGSE